MSICWCALLKPLKVQHQVLATGANVILTTKGIDDMSLKYFVEAGAIAVRRVPKDDLRCFLKPFAASHCRDQLHEHHSRNATASRQGTARGLTTCQQQCCGERCQLATWYVRFAVRRRIAKATGGQVVMALADMDGNETFEASNLGTAEEVNDSLGSRHHTLSHFLATRPSRRPSWAPQRRSLAPRLLA